MHRSTDRHAVVGDLAARADRPQAGCDAGDPIAFLGAQLLRVTDLGRALGLRGEHADDGDLIDAPHRQRTRDGHTPERATAHLDVTLRFHAAGRVAGIDIHGSAHGAQHVEDAGATRIQSDAGAPHAPPGTSCGERQEERSGADVAGDVEPERGQRPRCDADARSVNADRETAHAQQPLRVIASWVRL